MDAMRPCPLPAALGDRRFMRNPSCRFSHYSLDNGTRDVCACVVCVHSGARVRLRALCACACTRTRVRVGVGVGVGECVRGLGRESD